MHGGLKVYRGSATAARNYVEAGRARADDYYLAEGTGIAERYIASPEGVRAGGTLTGDAYETWVGGYDPDTGAAKGRLRSDDQAVRFVEVVVNGPKSWSLAAALHPEIAAAYDGAQDRAAEQVIGWLAQHATTRVGPRGHQVQVPVQEIEAAVVRHYTSRAGDPHRHLHLQINARVLAEDTWRGLHTVGVRDSLGAINGIGHAGVICDPDFRAALAGAGFTLDQDSGEIVELAGFVGSFSARAAQIGRNVDRIEATWRLDAVHVAAYLGGAGTKGPDKPRQLDDLPAVLVQGEPGSGKGRPEVWVADHAGVADTVDGAQAVTYPHRMQAAPCVFGQDPGVDLQMQMPVGVTGPGGVVPHHRGLDLLDRHLDLMAPRPDPGGRVLGEPADDLLGGSVLGAVVGGRDLGVKRGGQRPRLWSVDHHLHEPDRSSVGAHPALGCTRGRVVPADPRLVGVTGQRSPIAHPHGWRGEVTLCNAGAFGEVVVIGTPAIGLDIAARSSGRAAIDL